MSTPNFGISYDELPSDPKRRHEILVDLFGRYIFWVKRMALERIAGLVESSEKRDSLGRLFREVFDSVAQFDTQQQSTSIQLAETAVGEFAGGVLTMLGGEGFDDRLGDGHVFRFRLDIEICDAKSGEVIETETINRGGQKFFAEYWGRWRNRYAKES